MVDNRALNVYSIYSEHETCTKGGEIMSIGTKLKALRAEKKKSQQQVADDLNITKSALAMYERGDRIPRDEVKVRIANYYGETVQSLFFSS